LQNLDGLDEGSRALIRFWVEALDRMGFLRRRPKRRVFKVEGKIGSLLAGLWTFSRRDFNLFK